MGAGPMIYSPMSEFYGRRIIYILSFIFYLAFQFPVAFGKNIETILINRLISGLAGSAFMAVAGGTVSDLFPPKDMGAPMMVFTASPFLGPSFGPLLGNYITVRTNWRWIFRVMIIWTGIMLFLIIFFVPETFRPVLLRWKARRLRKETGDQEYIAPIDQTNRTLVGELIFSIKRPFLLLLFDPMVFCLCLYSSILLGINYLFFQAFVIVFENNHHISQENIGLTFLGLLCGVICGVFTESIWRRLYIKLADKHGGHRPEFRLPQAMLGAIFIPIGIFWFAFTNYASVNFMAPIVGSSFFGFGIILVFAGVFTYLVEAYKPYSASALAANGFMRSSFAAGFPLFSVQMYNTMGYTWASALLAFLTLICTPFPFIFFKYGVYLRSRSRYAYSE
ncbi:major facilitator superfamily domain-containing protein [Dipodascopsis uninucleata]